MTTLFEVKVAPSNYLNVPGSWQIVSKWVRTYILVNGIYWGYNPFTNNLLNSWDIQVVEIAVFLSNAFFVFVEVPNKHDFDLLHHFPNLSKVTFGILFH